MGDGEWGIGDVESRSYGRLSSLAWLMGTQQDKLQANLCTRARCHRNPLKGKSKVNMESSISWNRSIRNSLKHTWKKAGKRLEKGWRYLQSDSGVGVSWQGPFFFLETRVPVWCLTGRGFFSSKIHPFTNTYVDCLSNSNWVHDGPITD